MVENLDRYFRSDVFPKRCENCVHIGPDLLISESGLGVDINFINTCSIRETVTTPVLSDGYEVIRMCAEKNWDGLCQDFTTEEDYNG